jgi:hypothetical protein
MGRFDIIYPSALRNDADVIIECRQIECNLRHSVNVCNVSDNTKSDCDNASLHSHVAAVT